MIMAVARALMVLATCCLGESRREWALAMQAEFEAAAAQGQGLRFAAGCLVAACGEMPRHAEGRRSLADHALALGLLVPAAFLQFACAIGLIGGHAGFYGMLAMAGASDPYAAGAQLSAVPALLILWLVLGMEHLHMAWALLDRDWSGVVRAGALIAAATLTLLLVVQMLLLEAAFLGPVISLLPIELVCILAAAYWHGRLFTPPALGERDLLIHT